MTDRPTDGPLFLVIGWQSWGSGSTLEAAKRRFRTEGGRLTNGYRAYRFADAGDFAGVDQMGGINYRLDAGEPELILERKPKGAR